MRAFTVIASACVLAGSALESSKPVHKSQKASKTELPLKVGHSEADEAYRTAHASYKASLSKAFGLMESLKGAVNKLRTQAKTDFEKENKQLALLEKTNKVENAKMEKSEKDFENRIQSIVSKHKHNAASLLETKPVFDLSSLNEWKKKLQDAMAKLDQWKPPSKIELPHSSLAEIVPAGSGDEEPAEGVPFDPSNPAFIPPSFIQIQPFDVTSEKEHLKDVERDLNKATDKLAATRAVPTESEARTHLTSIQNKIRQLAEKLNSDIIQTNQKIENIRHSQH